MEIKWTSANSKIIVARMKDVLRVLLIIFIIKVVLLKLVGLFVQTPVHVV
jgi:hypothetical protein